MTDKTHNEHLYYLGLYETLCFIYPNRPNYVGLKYKITNAAFWKTK